LASGQTPLKRCESGHYGTLRILLMRNMDSSCITHFWLRNMNSTVLPLPASDATVLLPVGTIFASYFRSFLREKLLPLPSNDLPV